jgi:hypothetical protein
MFDSFQGGKRQEIIAEALVLLLAVSLAATVARPYADSWNDGSRLATVESLVDRHTWIIDDSIFVRVPQPDEYNTPLPYNPNDRSLLVNGTLDKLFINGHFYSDKSPVPALYLAGCYQVWQWATGWTAKTHADSFCWFMTFASSGLAYALSVWCIYRLSRRLDLPLSSSLLLSASFGLATVALPYTRQVNNHILLLAVAAALTLQVYKLSEEIKRGESKQRGFALLGGLAGVAYTIDLGTGPIFLLSTGIYTLLARPMLENRRIDRFSFRWSQPTLVFALLAVPWLVLHHALNYVIGGSIQPANANPEYFNYPGSVFATGNITGSWVHSNVGSFLLYAASMLFGKKGFLGHNLPLFMMIPALVTLWRRQTQTRRVLLWVLACWGGTWLLYAAMSNNSSGRCCSIRWFVPLLAPGYFVLALLLKYQSWGRIDLSILSAWGLLLVVMMREGPWLGGMVPFFWQIQAAALISWGTIHYLRRRVGLALEISS